MVEESISGGQRPRGLDGTPAGLKKADGTQVWPVEAAAARWSKDNPVDFRYTTGSCPVDVQCVVIEQATLHTSFGGPNSAARRQNVVCHEMGRALGLKHGRRRVPA